MAVPVRQQSLSLYRRLLRASRQWQGSKEEADYIAQEARQQFREHQHSTGSPQELAHLLEEGENRLAIALHYGIAFPRLRHADQWDKVPYVEAPKIEAAPEEAVASSMKDKGMAVKLAAAARRRRQRLAQQQQQQGDSQQHGGQAV
ncbi:hypothetical protein D9Q98_003158 [Chlorella vulgaris]|uniref:Complex 1 LYR protein domain-containing protein n=1 Tax=Chlorella vulgaris TaxID=3077 RepID=A0A9D4YZ59_CHLVU|nr:hypothetical protein D9Q98_003158 [Chlorella vulgaris]